MKPVIFLGPVFWWVFEKEKESASSLGLTFKGFLKACYLGIGLGMAFASISLLANIAKYEGLSTANFNLESTDFLAFLGINLVTSFSEVTLFMGFMLNRLKTVLKSEVKAAGLAALLFSLIHLPIMVFVYHYSLPEIFSFSFLTLCVGFGNSILMLKSNNLLAPILSQTFWGVSVYLFR